MAVLGLSDPDDGDSIPGSAQLLLASATIADDHLPGIGTVDVHERGESLDVGVREICKELRMADQLENLVRERRSLPEVF